MQDKLKQPAFSTGRFQLPLKDSKNIVGCCIGSCRWCPVEHHIYRIITQPFDGDFDKPACLAIKQDLIAGLISHHRTVIGKTKLLYDPHCGRPDVPVGRPETDRLDAAQVDLGCSDDELGDYVTANLDSLTASGDVGELMLEALLSDPDAFDLGN